MEDKDKEIHHLAEVYNDMLTSVQLPEMKVDDLLDLIDFYTRGGMDFEAEMYKRIAALKFPTHPDVILMCAHWEADEGNWQGVSSIAGVMDSSRYDEALFHMEKLVRMMLPEDAYEKMETTLSPLLELGDYDFLFDSAELFKDFGFKDFALKCMNKIPSSYPDYRQVLEMAAECYFYKSDFNSSLHEIDQAIDLNSFDDYLWAQSAMLHYKNKDFDKALDACEYSLAILKENPRAEHIKNIVKWHHDPNFDVASASYVRQDYTAMLEIGDLHYLKGEYKQAEAEYMAAGYFCPRDNRDRIIIVFKTSLCRAISGRVDDAVATLLSVLNQGFDIWPFAVELLQVLLQSGHSEKFSALFNPLIRLDGISLVRMQQLIPVLSFYHCYDDARIFWEQTVSCETLLSGEYKSLLSEAKLKLGL